MPNMMHRRMTEDDKADMARMGKGVKMLPRDVRDKLVGKSGGMVYQSYPPKVKSGSRYIPLGHFESPMKRFKGK